MGGCFYPRDSLVFGSLITGVPHWGVAFGDLWQLGYVADGGSG